MAEHTPGPWRQARVSSSYVVLDNGNRPTIIIARAMHQQIPANEVMANAALIAQAPDLLEQRDELLEACLRARLAIHDVLECGAIRSYVDDKTSTVDLLDNAIAKATPKKKETNDD